jgi:hypothetical protein
MNRNVKQAKGAAPRMAAEMNDSIQGGTMLDAQARHAFVSTTLLVSMSKEPMAR